MPKQQVECDSIPHSKEAEEAVVGSILISSDLLATAPVKPEWFYLERIRFIWEAFEALAKKKMPIDILTVSEQLDASGKLGEIGGAAYLTLLLNRVPTTLNFDGYVGIMREHYLRRVVLRGANGLAQAAYDMSSSVEDLLTKADGIIHNLTEHSAHEGTLTARQAVTNFDESDNADYSIATGFRDTDKYLDGGFSPQDLVLIAGRPGQGKTASLVAMVNHMGIDLRKRVAIFSLEMSTDRILARMAANLSGIDSRVIRKKAYQHETQEAQANAALDQIREARIYFDEHIMRTPSSLRLGALRLMETVGLDVIFIDYIQLMYADGGSKEGRVQEVSQISRALKSLARELNVPVVAACQLSRAVEQRSSQIPQLSDLRESGSLEQDSDIVIFLHEIPSPSIPLMGVDFRANSMQQIIAKNRDGATGSTPYLYVKPLSRFYAAQLKTVKVRTEDK